MTHPRTPTPRAAWEILVFRVASWLMRALLAVLLVLVLLQVVARNLVGHPLPWTDEAARLCLVWLTFLGAGALMAHGRHLVVDAVTNLLPRRLRVASEVISNLIVAVACGCVLVAGLNFAVVVAGSVSPALEISNGWFYGAALTGMLLMVLYAVANTVHALRSGTPQYQSAVDDVVEDVAGAPEPGTGTGATS